MSHTEKDRSNLLFTGAVSAIEAEGCRLLPMDYVELHRLACGAVAPLGCSVSLFTVPPVCVGHATLQIPSIGAFLWWEQCGKAWYGSDDVLGVIAYAYMCHYSRDAVKLDALYNRSDADSAMFGFRKMLGSTATTIELRAGLDRMEARLEQMFGDDNPDADESDGIVSATVYGDIVARLCSAYHNLTPRKVVYDLSPDECVVLLKAAPTPMGMTAPEDTSEFDAFAKFNNFVRKLKEDRKPCLA